MNETGTEGEMSAAACPPPVSRIFFAFLKLGLTAFGGPAIIAHIKELAVSRQKWLNNEAFKDGVVLSQSIPGATAMQVAAYVGLKAQGIKGASAAYVGLGLPAFFLMMFLSQFYATSRSIAPVVALFGGLQVIVVAIVAHAACTFGRDIAKSIRGTGLAVISAALLLGGINPFIVIVGAAGAGMALFHDLVLEVTPTPARPASPVKHTILMAAVVTLAGLIVLYFVNGKLFSLAVLMLRVNFFAFGGGLSSLPLMHHEIVARGWMDSKAFIDGIALGQVTPGPISITGTFIGYLLFGVTGAIIATIATFSPSFILLLVTEPYFAKLKSSQRFARASKGIVCCFVGLLFYVTYRFAHDIQWDLARVFLGVAAYLALYRKIDILLIVLVGALYSVVKF
jgi:chromate transporter